MMFSYTIRLMFLRRPKIKLKLNWNLRNNTSETNKTQNESLPTPLNNPALVQRSKLNSAASNRLYTCQGARRHIRSFIFQNCCCCCCCRPGNLFYFTFDSRLFLASLSSAYCYTAPFLILSPLIEILFFSRSMRWRKRKNKNEIKYIGSKIFASPLYFHLIRFLRLSFSCGFRALSFSLQLIFSGMVERFLRERVERRCVYVGNNVDVTATARWLLIFEFLEV